MTRGWWMGGISKQSDERLLDLARTGDHAAFGELVRRYRKSLVAYARRILRSEDLAEDAVQQSLLQAWCAIQRGTEVEHVKPWLFRIVFRSSLRLREVSVSPDPELHDAVVDLDTPHRQLEHRFAVRQALEGIAELPKLQRDALLLAVIGGSSYGQVARHLGVSLGAVRALVHRARTTLRSRAPALAPVPLLGALGRALGARFQLAYRVCDAGTDMRATGFAGALSKGGALIATATILVAGGAALRARLHAAAPRATFASVDRDDVVSPRRPGGPSTSGGAGPRANMQNSRFSFRLTSALSAAAPRARREMLSSIGFVARGISAPISFSYPGAASTSSSPSMAAYGPSTPTATSARAPSNQASTETSSPDSESSIGASPAAGSTAADSADGESASAAAGAGGSAGSTALSSGAADGGSSSGDAPSSSTADTPTSSGGGGDTTSAAMP